MKEKIFSLFKPSILMVGIFLLIRIFSFYTYQFPVINSGIGVLLVFIFIFLCKKNIQLAWIVLIGEILLDGSGHFFEIQGLILRTWFLGIFGIFWFAHTIKEKQLRKLFSPFQIRLLCIVAVVFLFATINGFLQKHAPMLVIQDMLLYGFVALIFPAMEFFQYRDKNYFRMIQGFMYGSAIFSILTFFLYSSGIAYLPDTYYHWFRNVVGGKITDLGNDFFRIVTSEHLILVPLFLLFTSFLIHDPKNKKWWTLLCFTSIPLALNFTRMYFVAIVVGILILSIKNSFKKWFVVSSMTCLSILVFFCAFSFLGSKGNTMGLEQLGLKFAGTKAPSTETSGAIRLAILPEALKTIQKHPWIGSGLGTTVTYIDPTTKQSVTRTQFDWGYLEVIAELGIVGTLIFLFFLAYILFAVAQIGYFKKNHEDRNLIPLSRGLLAGAVSLFIINITTPALFQGFGILYFAFIFVFTSKYSQLLPAQSKSK